MAKYLCVWVRAYWFSVTLFSKWLPGGHIRFFVSGWHGFGSVTQVCFGISVSKFMCMSFVAVGRSVTIVSYVAFKMAALWFWTMFNCNPPIAHCHPLLWGGGILVDHWSTISSCHWFSLDVFKVIHFGKTRDKNFFKTTYIFQRLLDCWNINEHEKHKWTHSGLNNLFFRHITTATEHDTTLWFVESTQ